MLNEDIANALNLPYEEAREAGRREEREWILGWLRRHSSMPSFVIEKIAQEIEAERGSPAQEKK